MSFKKASETEILAWTAGDLSPFAAYLLSGSVHGKPGLPTAELGRIDKILRGKLGGEEQFALGQALLSRPEYCARNLGVGLIESGWPRHRKEVEKGLLSTAEDEDWIVREYAASSCARLLDRDFPHFSRLFEKWAKKGSVNAKRAVALAVKYDARSGKKERLPTYLRLIEPLIGEEAEYIRKNLGPFAIGDCLLSRYPEALLAACSRWAKSENENTRWNSAMVFTAAASRKFKKEGRKIPPLSWQEPQDGLGKIWRNRPSLPVRLPSD
jgi:hypothetical protein